MNQILLDKIQAHFKGNDILEMAEIEAILQIYPQAQFQGTAYRVVETESQEMVSVQQDSSFTKSLEGIKYFLSTRDFKNIQLLQAHIYGIDLSILALLLKRDSKISIPEYVFRELEVIPLEVSQVSLKFQGPASNLKI